MKIEKTITINLTEEERETLERAIAVLDSIDIQLERLDTKTATSFNKSGCQDLANKAWNVLTDFLDFMED